MNKVINKRNKIYRGKYKEIIKFIKKYDRIVVFRHVKPDYDAFGTQLAVVSWIKDNFPGKEVHATGEDNIILTDRCFPSPEFLPDSWFDNEFLAIVVDTGNQIRISDQRYQKATAILKIDHHPEVDKYGDVQIVDTSMSAVGELVANIFITLKKYKLSAQAATYLFKAIVGDTNRFLFDRTNDHTFEVAKNLVLAGIDINQIYRDMYVQDISTIKFTKWVLENYQTSEHGVAYYIVEQKDMEELSILPIQGKDCMYLFDHFDTIHIWLSAAYDNKKDIYRVAIRSDAIPIDKIAIKYKGGGHAQASGAKAMNKDELYQLIDELDKLLV